MDYCFCPVCKKNEERIRKGRIDLLFLFILTVFFLASPFAVQGISGNSSFYAVYPTCTVNNTNIINCSETSIKINCYVPHFQFVQFVTYNLNSTTYLASQLPNPNQNNWTLSTTLSQKYEQANFVYNFSSAVITDTSNIIAVYPQNITINQSCTDCFPNIVNINSSCGNNDLKNVTYMDLQNCTYPIPPNTTASCNFCDSNWQCTNYSVCSASTKYKYCYAVSDLAGCFGQTNLPSDNFTGQFDDYTSLCNYLDFKTNTTLMSSFQANLVVSEYPYVETNTTINLEIFVSLAGNPFQISNVQMQIANTSFVFNYDPSSQTYKKSIILNEVGDYPFVITGRENTTTAFRIDGLFYSRRFVTLGVELFEDRNQSTRYKNNFAEVIALKNDNIKSQLGEDLLVQAEKLKKLNMII